MVQLFCSISRLGGFERFTDSWYYELICVISAFGYMLLFLLIYFNKSLQVHPMPIVMMISLVGGTIFFTYIFASRMCPLGLLRLLAGTLTFTWGSSYYEYIAGVVLWEMLVFYSIFYLNAMIWLNQAMAIDLIFMIKYPFRSPNRRLMICYAVTFFSSFIIGVLNSVAYHYVLEKRKKWICLWFLVTVVIYWITVIISIIYAGAKLRRPGIS